MSVVKVERRVCVCFDRREPAGEMCWRGWSAGVCSPALSPPVGAGVGASQSALNERLKEKGKKNSRGLRSGTRGGVGGGGAGAGMDHSALISLRSKNFRERSDAHFVDVIKEDR